MLREPVALPGGYSGEVLVDVLLGGLQGFQHVAKLRIVPLINVVTDDGQAPSYQAPGAAQREDGVMERAARLVSRTEGWICNRAWLRMGLRNTHTAGIRVFTCPAPAGSPQSLGPWAPPPLSPLSPVGSGRRHSSETPPPSPPPPGLLRETKGRKVKGEPRLPPFPSQKETIPSFSA